MSEVSASLVRELRERTGAGMMDCKKALARSTATSTRRSSTCARRVLPPPPSGPVARLPMVSSASYIHAGGKIGVLIEVNCETDFVARTDDFQNLVKELAMQIAAANPRYVRREEVPAAVLEQERSIYAAQAANSGKPPQVIEKMVDGKVEKFFADVCLLEQPFIKDPDKQVGPAHPDAVAKLGENIVVRRFARFQLGEQSSTD